MTDPAPWADDAAAYFGDNAEAIEAFDRYQREKAQPYITKLQTESAPARDLWTKLNDAPDDALRELVGLVYEDHPDVVSGYETLFAEPAPAVEAVATPDADEPPAWAKPLIESHQEKVDREAREAGEAEYAEFKQGLKESHSLSDEDLALIDPFIATAKDTDSAVAAFKAYQAKFGTPVEPAPDPALPPVLEGGQPAPPLATQYERYEQIGDALRAFRARQAASATPPPVVG